MTHDSVKLLQNLENVSSSTEGRHTYIHISIFNFEPYSEKKVLRTIFLDDIFMSLTFPAVMAERNVASGMVSKELFFM